MNLDHLLRYVVERGASDLHLKSGTPPMMRLHGDLIPVADNVPEVTNDYICSVVTQILSDKQQEVFVEEKEIDVSYGVRGIGRFRVNIFRQRGSVSMVIRSIAVEIPSLKQLGLPKVIEQISRSERGLILVTGVTGAGKSTTMAAIINQINLNQNKHIITIEDPIEFLMRDHKSIVTQRELGTDTNSFSKALRAALRQDPDVILIGEMRDKDTIETALMAAETGHLVISTLHTKDSKETVNRILSFFPNDNHQHIRGLLAANLKSIISLRLAKRKDKSGFLPVVEVLINNARIAQMINNEKETNGILEALEDNSLTGGMQSFDQHLIELVKADKISTPEAFRLSNNQKDFELRLKGLTPKGEKEWQQFHEEREESEESATQAAGIWDDLPDLELETEISTPSDRNKKAKESKSDLRIRRKKT